MKKLAITVVYGLLLTVLCGCYSPRWPAAPVRVFGPADAPDAVLYASEPSGRERYMQSYRDGVKRTLLWDADGDGMFEEAADLDKLDAQKIRHVIILLDGLPYELMDELYREGHFRLFYPPAKMAAPFPSLTDISYSGVFGIPGTSCYESVIYNPKTNKLDGPYDVYLSGDNELWASRLDYRQATWVDAISYIYPRWASQREFHAMFAKARKVLDARPAQQNVLIYSISTDAAAHMIGWQRTREVLFELDRYIERLMYDRKGQVGLVLMADHGNNFVADSKRVDLEGALTRAGLRPLTESGFRKPHDVVLPTYGLLSLVRSYCQSEPDRQKVIDAWLATDGVEHVMWRIADTVFIARSHKGGKPGERSDLAEIRCRQENGKEYFSYTPTQGDPLELLPLLEPLHARVFEDSDEDGAEKFYESHDLLHATIDHAWPDPLYRIWHGLTDNAAVVPDVAASLDYGYFYGSKGLNAWTKLNGTHGGLKKRDTLTFFMSSMFAPPAVLRTSDVPDVINENFEWTPPTEDPQTKGLQKYLHRENPTGPGMRNLK